MATTDSEDWGPVRCIDILQGRSAEDEPDPGESAVYWLPACSRLLQDLAELQEQFGGWDAELARLRADYSSEKTNDMTFQKPFYCDLRVKLVHFFSKRRSGIDHVE